jgi:non-specific serine/threonine protein kinase
MFNFKFIKDRSKPGSWRRGYDYFQRSQILEIERQDNIVKAKVKGSFKDSYNIELELLEDDVVAHCDCPLKEEWCKHAVAVGLETVKKHIRDEFITEKTGQTFEYPEENPPSIKKYFGNYKFVLDHKRRPKCISIQIIDRKSNQVVNDIESLLKAVVALQRAGEITEFNPMEKVELGLIQEIFKQIRPTQKYPWYDIPTTKFDAIMNYLPLAEEVVDAENQKRLIFLKDEWKLVLSVNVSAVGNVLLSLHWHRPNSEDVYPYEEVESLARTIQWGKYKNVVFPISTPESILPHYLTKSTFTDIRDDEGGKFVYEELPKLRKLMPVEISETLERLTLEQRPPKSIVKLTLNEQLDLKSTLDFEYDGNRVSYSKTAQKTPYITVKYPKEDLIYWVKRNLKYEKKSYDMLLECRFQPMQTNNLTMSVDDAVDFYNFHLPHAPRNWAFESDDDLDILKIHEAPLLMNAKADFDKTTDSFNLEFFFSLGKKRFFFDEIEEHFRNGKKYCNLDGQGFVEVPATQILMVTKALNSFDATKDDIGDKYHIKTFRAGIIAELLDSGVEFKMSKKFQKFWDQISTFNTMEEVALPKGLNAELREYQAKGLSWLWFLYSYGLNGILADDMGLGKTVQTLALIQKAREEKGQTPSLVICPTTVVFNWENEIAKFTPGLKVINLTGATRASLYKGIKDADVVITSYALVRRDIDKLKKYDFRFIVLDESQNIKNADSQTAQAVKSLKSVHKFALSGTPIENRLSELWSIFDFLMPDFLYDEAEFNYRFVVPIMEREDRTVGNRLKAQIFPFILRRMKRDVAKDLPDKVENLAYCEMTPEQREFYTEVLDATKQEIFGLADGGRTLEKNRMSIFAALLRLRQICCHPRLFDKNGERGKIDSGKFEKLKSMLEEIIDEGHRVLLFSQFVDMLDIIKDWLKKKGIKHEYLTGQTKDRKEKVERFNEDSTIPIFLISLKAGGTGLNLTGADYVIHYDPWWNPAVEDQATDRAYRIGQTKKVFVYRIITKGTVEEKIQKLKSKKRDLVDSIISVDRDIGKSLTYDDLKEILSAD